MTDTVNVPVDEVLDAVAEYLVEQYGKSFGLNHHLDRARIKATLCAQPEAPKVGREPVAWRWKANTTHPLLGHAVNTLGWNIAPGHPGFKIEGGLDPSWFDIQPLYTNPAPASDEILEALREVVAAMRKYEVEVDGDAPHAHVEMMDRADRAIAKHKGPQS